MKAVWGCIYHIPSGYFWDDHSKILLWPLSSARDCNVKVIQLWAEALITKQIECLLMTEHYAITYYSLAPTFPMMPQPWNKQYNIIDCSWIDKDLEVMLMICVHACHDNDRPTHHSVTTLCIRMDISKTLKQRHSIIDNRSEEWDLPIEEVGRWGTWFCWLVLWDSTHSMYTL